MSPIVISFELTPSIKGENLKTIRLNSGKGKRENEEEIKSMECIEETKVGGGAK